ncbi:MAG: hypothetical protein K9M57_07285 [Phycisphaerae bacterium]|nr:hypothetical protein [Phycisphaerae bacterium]
MNKSLIVLNEHTDHLWRRYLLRVFHDSLFVDLSEMAGQGGVPYHNDIAGWRQWLQEHQVTQVICLDPTPRSQMIISAGILNDVFLIIYLTRCVSKKCYDGLRIVDRWVDQYRCAGPSIGRQLRQFGLNPEKVTVDIPNVEMIQIDADRRNELRKGIGDDGPVLLALPRPDDKKPLYHVVWTAAILKHIYHNLRLVVAGQYNAEQKQVISNWQRDLLAEAMIHLDDQSDFDALAAASDIIVAGDGRSGDVIRMRHARKSGRHIVAPAAGWKDDLQGCPHATIVPKGKPREMASAILSLLEKA